MIVALSISLLVSAPAIALEKLVDEYAKSIGLFHQFIANAQEL